MSELQSRMHPAFITPLSVQFPLTEGGDDVTVTAANVQQLGQLVELLGPVLGDLTALPPDMVDRLVGDEGPTHGDVLVLLELLSSHPSLAQQAVAVGMGKGWDLMRVNALMPDQFAYLFAVVVQVNADFFARALPALRAAAGKFSALLPAKPSSTPGPAPSAS